jgi:non-heme chloroperoxidase
MDEFQKSTLAKPIDSVFYRVLVDEGLKTPASVFQAALKGILQVDLVPQLKKVQCPALIVWGDKDMICLKNGQETMMNNLKDAKLVIYEGSGHSPHWEVPKRVAVDLLHFFQSIQLKSNETKGKK